MTTTDVQDGGAVTARRSRTGPHGVWLALLAGPISFGVAAPALILGDVARDLLVSRAAVAWAVTAFGWGIAVGTPLTGALLRRSGVRVTLAASAVSLACGAVLVLAVPVLPALVAGMALQAFGSAGCTSTAMSLARTPGRMGVVSATLSLVGAVSPLVGPLVSGVLGWRAVFVLPLAGLLAVPAVLRHAAEPGTPESGAERFDVPGAVLLTALVTALVLVPTAPLPAGAAALVLLGVVGLRVRARPAGFVPAVAVRPAFLVPCLLAFALAVVNFGLLYAVPPRIGELTSWSAGQVGAALMWPLLAGGALSFAVVAASARFGRYVAPVAVVGFGLLALAMAWAGTLAVVLLLAQGVASLGAASGQGVFALRATAALPDEERPRAIGLFNLCFLLGPAFGPAVAVLGVF